jgi:hypothetical protein
MSWAHFGSTTTTSASVGSSPSLLMYMVRSCYRHILAK